MAEPLRLKDAEPLAKGHSRLVFRHPSNDEWIIKVIRPEVIEARFGRGAPWYKRMRRSGRYLSYARETHEYLAAWAAHDCELHFVQKVIGFVTTDLGLGLVLEAAHDREGRLAPTLAMLVKSGRFDEKARRDLERFFESLLEAAIVVSDLNAGNLVYAHSVTHGDHFVLIDGLGVNSAIPLKAMSRAFNRFSKRGRIRRLRRKIDQLLATHAS